MLDDYGSVARSLVDWASIESRASLHFFEHSLGPAEAISRLAEYDVLCLMRERMPMPRSLIEALPRLRAIVTTGRVTANLDLGAARDWSVQVVGAEIPPTSAGATDTAELAWALILALARNLVEESGSVQAAGWQRRPGRSLQGLTLGLLGFGRVARAMVPPGQAFGMRTVAWSPRMTARDGGGAGVEYVPREQLFAESDVVSLHLPATPATRSAVGHAELQIMKRSALLINTARADVLDHAALLDALSHGRLAGAALDVFDAEPLPFASPLRGVPNLLLTPHLGFATHGGLRSLLSGVIVTLGELLTGLDGRAG